MLWNIFQGIGTSLSRISSHSSAHGKIREQPGPCDLGHRSDCRSPLIWWSDRPVGLQLELPLDSDMNAARHLPRPDGDCRLPALWEGTACVSGFG